MKKIILLFSVVLLFASCEPTYEKEYSWAYPVAGDWTVQAYIDGENLEWGALEIKVYNSSFGKDSIWIDDYAASVDKGSYWQTAGNIWGMKVKAAVDMNTKTFQTTGTINGMEHYPITIKILNGKVINNDSIYFEVQFEDDYTYDDNGDVIVDTDGNPVSTFTNTYQIAGHRTTSYEEYMQQ